MSKNSHPILVTGGAGYIGTHVVKELLSRGHAVVVVDNLSAGYQQPIKILRQYGQVEFVKLDILDLDRLQEVFAQYHPLAVIHLAALLSVDESVKHPDRYFRTNVGGTLNVLEACRQHQVARLVFSSSCSVFGESQYLPIDEQHPKQPINPYGESKLASERMTYWYSRAYDLRVAVLRYFNVCGASQDGQFGDSKHPSPHLVQNLVRGAMQIAPFALTCPTVDTPDGTPIRDYIDVEDLARAHALAEDYLQQHAGWTDFNLGNGRGYSVKEMLTTVEQIVGQPVSTQADSQPRQGEYAAVYADPRKAERLLGWRVQKDLAASITSLRTWYQAHPDGYAA